MQRYIRRLRDPLCDESAMRLQNTLAMAACLAGIAEPFVRYRCDHFTTDETATPNRAATDRSTPRQGPQP
jgi:hypothetical protein